MSRREQALVRIDVTKGRGLEVGPLHNPIVRKQEADIYYADHMSAEDLQHKYRNDPVPPDDIVPVDYVLKGKTLSQAVKGKKFDYIIASHVIEHIPDMVRWFQDLASILTENGMVSLVIPDKRFTFDIMRNESRPADVMGAYLDKYSRTSAATMYDFLREVRDVDVVEVWNNPYKDYGYKDQNPLKKVLAECQKHVAQTEYVDAHCFVLTPYSFFEILRNLVQHDLFDFEVIHFGDTQPNEVEFYVTLKKSRRNQKAKLKTIPEVTLPPTVKQLQAEIHELRQQLDAMRASTSWRITQPMRKISQKLKGKE